MTNSSTANSNVKKYFKKLVSSLMAAAVFASFAGTEVSAAGYVNTYSSVSAVSASAVKLDRVTMKSEVRISNDSTHPYNYQTSRITLNWNPVNNAQKYQIFMKTKVNGTYSGDWTRVKTVDASQTSYTVKNLERNTEYAFKVRAVADGYITGTCSKVQKIKTARIDYDKAGWQAMCRIVYHEVGQINDTMWDKPIVYVSDCVVNRYEAAKYLNDPVWAPYYRRYSSVQDVIYTSGGFMSSTGLTRDGATYSKCTAKVKNAVYGAVYDKVMVGNTSNDHNVFYWSNTSYRPNSSKIAYSYKIPWGYFNIWSEYWG